MIQHNVQQSIITDAQLDQFAAGTPDGVFLGNLKHWQYEKWQRLFDSAISNLDQLEIEDALLLIDRAQAANPSSYFETATYPTLSLWAWATSDHAIGSFEGSLAFDTKYLNSVAAVFALRAGIRPFEIQVPIVGQRVHLPTLGCVEIDAHIPLSTQIPMADLAYSADGQLTITYGNWSIQIAPHGRNNPPSWLPVRPVTLSHQNYTTTIIIDDVDPYRHLGSEFVPVNLPQLVRLNNDDFLKWKQLLEGAWKYLVEYIPDTIPTLSHSIRVITPISRPHNDTPRSVLRSGYGFGHLMVTYTDSSSWMTSLLMFGAHKSIVRVLHDKLPLHHADHDVHKYFGPWSMFPVSLQASLESMYTHVVMTKFWKVQADFNSDDTFETDAKLQFTRWQSRVPYFCESIKQTHEVTMAGRRFLDGLTANTKHTDVQITPRLRQLTNDVETDFRVCWRIQNLRVEMDNLEKLSSAWLASMPCPANYELEISTIKEGDASALADMNPFKGYLERQRLGTLRISDGDEFQAAKQTALPANVFLVNGQIDEAIEEFSRLITDNPSDGALWGGLVVACKNRNEHSSNALVRFPEVIRSLHCLLHYRLNVRIDPLSLSAWFVPWVTIRDPELFDPTRG